MSRNYKEKIIKAFDQADQYEKFASIQKIVAKKLSDCIRKQFKTSVNHKEKISILEIGCGTGLLTQYLIDFFPDAHFVLTDISPEMLNRAKNKFKNHKYDLTFKLMDGEYPELDEKYDLICSSLTFQWFDNVASAIRTLTNYLKQNGYLICSTLTFETFKEWRSIYNDNDFSCNLQTYPSIESIQSVWPETGTGRWETDEIIVQIDTAIDFFKGLRSIGASVPLETSKPLKLSQFKKVLSDFSKNYNYCSYHIAYGVFRKFSAKGFFVTGTDTDIGKTIISACLTKLLNAVYWKPIQTGLNCDIGDTNTVCHLAELSETQYLSPIIKLQAPLSPEDAARLENRELSLDHVNVSDLKQEKKYIVEGAGGIFVPINDHLFIIDLIEKINLPVIVVARTILGTLNHTLMTIEALRNRNIKISGVILNGPLNEDCKNSIISHGKVKILGQVPFLSNVNPDNLSTLCECISIPEEMV